MGRLIRTVVLAVAVLAVSGVPALAAPGNDNFGSATLVNVATSYANQTNVAATTETDEPAPLGSGNPIATVWYKFAAVADGTYTIDTCSLASSDTVIALYVGSSVGGLSQLGSDDDGCGNAGRSKLVVPLNGGFTYYVQVGSAPSASTGTFQIHFSGAVAFTPPGNDAFSAATPIDADTVYSDQTNVGATTETPEPQSGSTGTPKRTVWYAFTPTRTGRYQIDTCQTNPGVDTLLQLYTGTTNANAAPLPTGFADDGCGQNNPFTGNSLLVTTLTAGTTYHLQVGGYVSPSSGPKMGTFKLAISQVTPLNDNYQDAIDITGTSPTVVFDTTGATQEMDEPDHGDASLTKTIWYIWDAPAGAAGLSTVRCYRRDMRVDFFDVDGGGVATESFNAPCARQFVVSGGATYLIAIASSAGVKSTLRIVKGGYAPSQPSLAFDAQEVGTAGSVKSVTFTNSSPFTLGANAPHIYGPNRDDFAIVGGSTCDFGALAGSSCAVNVRFSPSATGPSSATLGIDFAVDRTGGDGTSVDLTGTGTAPTADTTGTPGTAGGPGPAGAVGPVGATGASGAVGPQGAPGAAGTAGAQGPAGSPGAAGPVGPVGPTGPAGVTGPAGSAGAAGAQGRPASAKCKAKKPKGKAGKRLKARCKLAAARRGR